MPERGGSDRVWFGRRGGNDRGCWARRWPWAMGRAMGWATGREQGTTFPGCEGTVLVFTKLIVRFLGFLGSPTRSGHGPGSGTGLGA